jgi:hypothetical protein
LLQVGVCAQGHGYSYWALLEFDASGNVLPFAPFVDSFTLDIVTGPAASAAEGDLKPLAQSE